MTERQPPLTPAANAVEIVGKGVYSDLPSLLDAFAKLSATKYHVCFPVLRPDVIPPLHGLALRQVALDTRLSADGKPLGGDFYADKGSYRLTKVGLGKLARALGISWHPVHTRRLDDGADPRYCAYQACGVFRQLDGTDGMVVASREMDLRDGSDHGIRTDAELGQARKFIAAHAEARAKNRVIREVAGIKSGYSKEEMSKPFVVCSLVFTGQTDDPELRREVVRVMAQRAMGSSQALFGPMAIGPSEVPAPTPAPPVGAVADDDHDDVPPEELEDDGRRVTKITDVRMTEGKRKDGGKWLAYHVVTEDGEEATTFSKTLGNIALDARENEGAVAIEVERGEHGLTLKSISILPEVP